MYPILIIFFLLYCLLCVNICPRFKEDGFDLRGGQDRRKGFDRRLRAIKK